MSSEDPKLALKERDWNQNNKPFVGIAVLVLSLLLAVTVAALVYQSVNSGQAQTYHSRQTTSDEKPAKTEVDVHSTITLNTDDNKKVKEQISYSQVSKVAYYHGADGSFEANDFGKGLHITRDSDDRVCYVIAVGASNASEIHDFERLIQENDGSEMAVHDRNVDGQEAIAQILPGEIEDTSFIPQGAHKECTSGYKWMSFISKDTDVSDSHDIEKRAVCRRRICIYFTYLGNLYRYCYWYYFVC